jgi:hypothetical protein
MRFFLCYFFIGSDGGGGDAASGGGSDGSYFGLDRQISTAGSRVPRDLLGGESVTKKRASASTETALVGKGPRY